MLTQKWTLICAPDGGGCTHAPCIPVLSLNAAALITRGPWLLDPASANRDWKELAPHPTLPFKYYPGQKSRGILKLISKRCHSDLLVIALHAIRQHAYVSIIPRPAGPYTKIINFPGGTRRCFLHRVGSHGRSVTGMTKRFSFFTLFVCTGA